MKKGFAMFMAGLLSLSLTGCGKSDEEQAKEVQGKIEKAGWKIEHDPDAGTAVDYLEVKTGTKNQEIQSLDLTLSKEDSKILTITYENKSDHGLFSESLSYNLETKEDDFFIYNSLTTCVYNPATQEVNETLTDSKNCKTAAPKHVKALSEERDSALKKADITLDELYKWGVWYHQNND